MTEKNILTLKFQLNKLRMKVDDDISKNRHSENIAEYFKLRDALDIVQTKLFKIYC